MYEPVWSVPLVMRIVATDLTGHQLSDLQPKESRSPLALILVRFEHIAFCLAIDSCPQFSQLSQGRQRLDEIVEAKFGETRNFNTGDVSAILFQVDALGPETALDSFLHVSTQARDKLTMSTPCLSTLLMATTSPTSSPASLTRFNTSLVCGMTPSSAATTRTTISVTVAPLARISVKAACPGVSRKVIIESCAGSEGAVAP